MDDNKFAGAESFAEATPFGTLPDGRAVTSYTLCNENGIKMRVLDYGATIQSLKVPSANGLLDVALGFDTIEDYIKSADLPAPPHFGAAIGRYAGRIKNAKFTIGKDAYQLDANNGKNILHGGAKGFDKVLWEVIVHENDAITLQYISKDGDQKFPGELRVTVSYLITDKDEIKIKYKAQASHDTIINMTQHTYFNLDGHDADVSTQQLMINSDTILEIDEANIPSGRLIAASLKDFDFTAPRNVPAKIDDSFVVADTSQAVAQLESFKSGLKLRIFSDQPSVHLYVVGDLFGRLTGKEGVAYHTLSGICFESQNYPDAPNQPYFPNAVLRAGETYTQKTIWKFERNLNRS